MKIQKQEIKGKKAKRIKLRKNFEIGTFLKLVVWGEIRDRWTARCFYTRNPQKTIRKLNPEFVTAIFYDNERIY